MTRLIVGPFNRVEGDLEVKLEIADGRVGSAHVVSTLYRGFERMLIGKSPDDALVYAPRICGICSVSQSVAAAKALAAVSGLAPTRNGAVAINLIHAAENVADHLTHFYLFFMPDFARDGYAGTPWHAAVSERFKAVSGSATRDMLPARAQFMHVLGVLAGKWPHTLSIQPGGTTRSISAHEIARLSAILAGFRRFLQTRLFGDSLERIASLSDSDQLDAWASEKPAQSSDFRLFLHVARALDLEKLGRGYDRFMSYGAYHSGDAALFPAGTFAQGQAIPLDIGLIREDLTHAWYDSLDMVEAPRAGTTVADVTRAEAYSWCKAPRLDGNPMEVGALARQAIAGHPLIRDLLARSGGNVYSRVVARLLEISLVVIAMQQWLRDIDPGETFCTHGAMPGAGEGVGLTEAARGSLGHWLRVGRGRIETYQIIAPTTWNFSPRDRSGMPGALEHALVGAPVLDGETEPVSVQHIVRSFDPCLVCTVH